VRPIVRRVGLHVAVLACLGAVAVAYTWPLAAHVRSHYLLREAAPEGFTVDLLFSSWILASDTRQLVNDPLHVFETNNLHPFRHTLAFGENMIGVALLVLPVQLLGDDPTLTHNVAMLACIVLTAWGVFLLVRELGGSALAAFVAGVLAIYSPPLWSAILLLPLVAAQWTPLALFCLVRLVRTHRWRWSALLGLAVAAAVWSSLQHGFFLIFGLAITVPVFAALSRHARQALPHAIAAGALAALLCVPIVQPYRAVRWELDTEAREGASWFALRADGIAPPFTHPLRHLAERLRSGEHVQDLGTLAPWILIGAGAVALAVRRRRGPVDVAAVVAVVAGGVGNLLFAFGPADPGGGWSLYTTLTGLVPGLAWVRVPARAVLYTHLVLTVVAGTALAAVLARVRSRAARIAVAGAALALGVVEAGWRPAPTTAPPARTTPLTPALRRLDNRCAIAELPASFETGGVALFRSTAHWRPLVDGFSGFFPITSFALFTLLNEFPSADATAFLQDAGCCAVVVRNPLGDDFFARVVADSAARGFAIERAGDEALIRLPAPPPPVPEPPLVARTGWRADPEAGAAGDRALDGDLETVWEGTTREEYGPDRLTVALGEPARIGGVAIDLGRRFRLYLRSYRVEGSLDGSTWTTLAEKLLASPPLASYRADYTHVRQRIDFPPALVRWLRIGPYRRPPLRAYASDMTWRRWGVAELHAYAVP